MTARTAIERQQRRRLASLGRVPDSRGYLPEVGHNLRVPLSAEAFAAFTRAGNGDLHDGPAAPARMRRVHSSSALVANVFDYWNGRDSTPLARALRLDLDITALQIEARFPTGLEGLPPTTDVALTLADGAVIGIESKFTEWLVRKSPSQKALKAKYFAGLNGAPGPAYWWADAGLPACQALAGHIAARTEDYRFFNANQLLKHALGLAINHGRNFAINYLYFDWPRAAASRVHRQEVARFAAAVGGELPFRALTYQELFAGLQANATPADGAYLDYLAARYFSR